VCECLSAHLFYICIILCACVCVLAPVDLFVCLLTVLCIVCIIMRINILIIACNMLLCCCLIHLLMKSSLMAFFSLQVDLSVSRDGNIHIGDFIMIVNPQPEDCSRCTHTLCMTLAEDTIYNVQERLCAETKEVVGSAKVLSPEFRNTFVVRR